MKTNTQTTGPLTHNRRAGARADSEQPHRAQLAGQHPVAREAVLRGPLIGRMGAPDELPSRSRRARPPA